MPTRLQTWIAVPLATMAIVLGARVTVDLPGTDIETTLQTLAVFLAGGWLGPWRGMAAVVLYLALGAVGLPVYADGGAGLAHLFGPTSGYLFGFIACAGVVGALWRGHEPTVLRAVGLPLLATALVLVLGVPVLAWRAEMPLGEAVEKGGLAPLPGGLLKAVVTTLLLLGEARWLRVGAGHGPAGDAAR